jgi:1-acyl-sn-glycerol-3-phosphate acyltransferase
MRGELYLRLHLWLVERRRAVLVATVLLSGACILISSRMDLDQDILATLPQRDQMVDEYRYTLHKFRQVDRVYLDVGSSTEDLDRITEAADDVYAGLVRFPAIGRVMYRFEMTDQRKVLDLLTGALPNLFSPRDPPALAKKIEPESVREYLTVMRRKLAGPEGMVLKDVVASDPIGMSSLVLAKVAPLQTGFGEARFEGGRIVSADGRHVLLMAEPRLPSSNSAASAGLVSDLLGLARAVEARFPGVRVAMTGGHRMTVDNARLIESDAKRCVFLGMAAMLVLCLTAYRRRWLAIVTFLPSMFGTLVAGVVLALGWGHLSAIATGFAMIAIGITVDYAIYVVYHLDNAAGLDRAGVGRAVARLVLPISVGALTTIAAFAVMTTSPIPGYQQLGIFGAAGVLFSAAFALVILPLLVPIPKQGGHPPLWLTRVFERFQFWRRRQALWITLAMVVLSVVTLAGVRRLRFEGDIARLNGITEPTRRDEALIRETWGDALGMTLVVARGATMDDALSQNDRAAEALARDSNVKAVFSLAAVCPSATTQQANLERWRQFWTKERLEGLHQTLGQVGGELGFRADAFDGFWRQLQTARGLLTLDSFVGTPLEQALRERVAPGPRDNAVSTLIKLEDRSQIGRLRQELPGLIVMDHQSFAQHIAALSKSGLGRFALWTAVAVAALVYFSLGSIELVVVTLLPLAIGLLWTFGTMGWLGLPVDIMNSVFVIFIIGVGEDYSVFLVTSKLDEWRGRPARLAATSASVVISALTTIFGFAVLAFARHPVLFSLGTTVLIGMAFAFAATLVLTPLLMDLLLFADPPRGAPRWWHLLGTAWVTVNLGGSELFLWYVLRPILKLVSPSQADDRLRRTTSWMARGLVKWLPFGKLEFQGLEPRALAKPAIVISNHQSAVDVMLMVSLPGDVRQTAKRRVFDSPVLGIGCKLLGHILVEPNDPQTTLQRCREKLAEGASVHFYPEGTRSPDGWVQRFHRGAFELAVELNQEILPIVLCDTWTAVPRDGYWFEPYHARVCALPRVTPLSFDYRLGSLALMRHCETLVREALQQHLEELNTPTVLRRKVERLYRYQGKYIEQFVHWKLKADPLFTGLHAVVPEAGSILDLGCGHGLATNWLSYGSPDRTFLGVDYDEDRIRVARRTAPASTRIRFDVADILEWSYPRSETILLLDVLHYWTAANQQLILNKARQALAPGGRLVVRDAARQESAGHCHVERWERFACWSGHTKRGEGLHFQTIEEMTEALRCAGFSGWEIRPEGGRGSNVLLVAWVEGPQSARAQTP